uniref:DUF4738 domain-containing protein n=2 Tax=unclassified Prevotella TaxID=2638335 RepID=A0AB33J4P7_9BACT
MNHLTMQRFLSFIISCTLIGGLTGCGKSKKSQDIITHKPKVQVVNKKPQKIGDYQQTRDVEWLGATYKVLVVRQANQSLQQVDDGNGNRYYDNQITVKIIRKDGSEFFNRAFTKADFESYVDDIYKKNSALLGIVLDEAQGDKLRFAASVGSPDRMSDEYVPLVLVISRTGGVSISKDSQLDTGNGTQKTEDELAEEEGI